jgi:hypothetical protein
MNRIGRCRNDITGAITRPFCPYSLGSFWNGPMSPGAVPCSRSSSPAFLWYFPLTSCCCLVATAHAKQERPVGYLSSHDLAFTFASALVPLRRLSLTPPSAVLRKRPSIRRSGMVSWRVFVQISVFRFRFYRPGLSPFVFVCPLLVFVCGWAAAVDSGGGRGHRAGYILSIKRFSFFLTT